MKKAKRRLKNFNFEAEGAHVALVGKHQGGPANGYETLVTKATNKIPESFVQKAEEVQVTLSMTEFLRRFFGMWMDDAEVLAKVLGYPGDDSEYEEVETYDDYIMERVESITLLKQLFRAEDVYEALSELDENQFETILKDQQMIEKAMSSEATVEKSTKGGVSNQNTDEDVTKMTEEEKTEMVSKSEVESLIAKALEEKQTELQKAQETIDAFKAKEAEQVEKSRKAALKDAVKTDEAVETLYKSLEGASQEDFDAAVEVLKGTVEASDESNELFTEKGVDTESEIKQPNDATRKLMESKYNK